jgi:hypothetical protein
MTEYAPRTSQDYNFLPYNQHVAMSHYSNGNGLSYLYGNGQIPYQTAHSPCSPYSSSYGTAHGSSTSSLYIPTTSAHHYRYSLAPSGLPTLPSQYRATPLNTQYGPSVTQRPVPPPPRLVSPREYESMDSTEGQESPNSETMLSEPVVPPLEGYPDVKEFDKLMKKYVSTPDA